MKLNFFFSIKKKKETTGITDKIQVTELIYQELKDTYDFELRGEVEVKGRGKMITYLLIGKKSKVTESSNWFVL